MTEICILSRDETTGPNADPCPEGTEAKFFVTIYRMRRLSQGVYKRIDKLMTIAVCPRHVKPYLTDPHQNYDVSFIHQKCGKGMRKALASEMTRREQSGDCGQIWICDECKVKVYC